MRYLPILLLLTSGLFACSKSAPHMAEPERPGQTPPEPTEQDAAVSFAPGNPAEVAAGTDDGSIHIILYREAGTGAPQQTCALALTAGADFARISPEAVFEAGAATAGATLDFSPAKMGRRRRSVTVALPAHGSSHTIVFTKEDAPAADAGTYAMFDDGVFSPVSASCTASGATCTWVLEKEGFQRRFSVADGSVSVLATGGVTPAASYGQADLWPGVAAQSFCTADGIGLNVCSVTDGRAAFPHSEYYLAPLPDGSSYACATIRDGWLLPVVAIDGALLDAAQHTWTAPARIDSDGTVTVFGPYHNASPLQRINAAPLSSAWRIVTEGASAVMHGQFSGFTNAGVFPFAFSISAQGTVERRAGGMTIIFDTPMHNCTADGQAAATADRVWGSVRPVVIDIQQSSISAI